MHQYQETIATTRYARWIQEDNRRETWRETVNRYVKYWEDKSLINSEEANSLFASIFNLEVMPSMRALMTAGIALDRDNVAGFNCAYLPIDDTRAFDELMYILMCGTGVGYSVERQYVSKLPEIPEEMYNTDTTIIVEDSKIGWAKSLRQLIAILYAGEVPKWNLERVRAAGAPLKTFGGRASGPQPLNDLFEFIVAVFRKAKGDKLSSLEVHDICCKIAEVVVVGGVRRSALICLSNPSDGRLRTAKSGQWWVDNGQRALANNSACYTEKPEFEFFLDEMRALHESKSGERGVFSRVAAKAIAAKNGRRDTNVEFGTNPCSEIILRPNQFCNLSEVVIRDYDTVDTIAEKVEQATILGTLQSTLIDFRYLRPIWSKNTKEEALLGVSFTGIMDNRLMSGKEGDDPLKEALNLLKWVAIDTNREWSKKLGVNPSAAITCVKPSGTVSQLVDSASGIHPRFSPFYIRTIRQDVKDPVTDLLKDAGVPWEVDVTSASNIVFSFPQRAPEGAICADELGAMEQLRLWELYQDEWCEHKPSITVYYTDDEFLDVISWMWKNFDKMSGIALLPYSEHTYKQAPYQQCTEAEYLALEASMPIIDWERLGIFELEDNTKSSHELACVGASCEI